MSVADPDFLIQEMFILIYATQVMLEGFDTLTPQQKDLLNAIKYIIRRERTYR